MTLPGAAAGGWNTWDAEWPAAVLHLPTGAALRVGAYSASTNRFTDFPWSAAYRLGTHAIDGSEISVDLCHAGSKVALRLTADGADGVAGELTCADMAEWGLRFWLLLEFGSADADEPAVRLILPPGGEYVQPPVAVLERAPGGPAAAFGTLDRPADARLTLRSGALGRVMEEQGYYARPAAPELGRFAVFRFTAAEPRVVFAAAAASDAATATDRLRGVLADLARQRETKAAHDQDGNAAITRPVGTSPRGASGPLEAQRPLDVCSQADAPSPVDSSAAIRDVLGWNSVWDPANRRVYTASTRAWIARKFGGFGVWQIDGFLHAILAAHIGAGELAWDNIAAVLAGRTEQGNLPALAAATTLWADRSHPPVGAHACWQARAMTPDHAAAADAAGVLADAFGWWFEARDGNGNGLLEYGSAPVGDGHFVHTKQAAMDESSNDNSPVHDDATFDLATHTLDVEDVGLNSLLVHEGNLLARILPDYGQPGAADAIAARAAGLAEAVRMRLWDPQREVFAGRHWSGQFTRSLSPTSFYPMLAGIATGEQAEAMVQRWLLDPGRFGGLYPVAGTPHEDPAAADNVYWRGRVWPSFNYLVYLGLRRYRYDAAAAWLAERGLEMFSRDWGSRRCYENFSQRTGSGGDSPDAEPFYTWGVLLPMIADLETASCDPWDGMCFGCEGADSRAAVTYVDGHRFEARLGPRSTTLSRDGVPVLAADVRGRFRRFEFRDDGVSVLLPPAAREFMVGHQLAAPGARSELDGAPVPAAGSEPAPIAAGEHWAWLRIPASARAQRLEIRTAQAG
jgi:putative isomerase